jgi:hypothetical protein
MVFYVLELRGFARVLLWNYLTHRKLNDRKVKKGE